MSHDIPKIEVAELVAQAMAEANRQRGRLNLIVAGRSGVGKSTLINAVFGEELVATGQGRPVTLGGERDSQRRIAHQHLGHPRR